MSAAVRSYQHTLAVPEKSHHLVPPEPNKESIKHSKVPGQKSTEDHEGYKWMWDKVSLLWPGCEEIAYHEARMAILEQWAASGPLDKKFLEQAIVLLVDFRNRPLKKLMDFVDWANYLETVDIDPDKYFTWVKEQNELLTRLKNKGFENITLERFSDSLITADWRIGNDESAVVNVFLLHTEISEMPEIYLGPLGNSRIAVRLNSECLTPQETDLRVAESHGVDVINSCILLGMRYVSLQSENSKQSLLFVPMGNVFRMHSSRNNLSRQEFQEGNWKDTGVVLVMRIRDERDEGGRPGGLYMAKTNLEAGEDEESLRFSLDTAPFTLAKLQNINHLDLVPYSGLSEKPSIQLERLSVSELEIVRTGDRGDWVDDDIPPVGIFP